MKAKIRLTMTSIFLIIAVSIYHFYINPSFSGPVGGWEASKAKIEAKYGYNNNVRLAALQLGEALQKSIDKPNDVSAVGPVDDGMACIYGVLVSRGVDSSIANDSWVDIEEIVVSTFTQQRRYIRFNANLSGGVYSSISPDVSKCYFKVGE